MANGWDVGQRLIRPDFAAGLDTAFAGGKYQQHQTTSFLAYLVTVLDRLGRLQGKAGATIPVVDADPLKPSALPTSDSHAFFSAWEKKSNWKNEVTLKRFISQIPDS